MNFWKYIIDLYNIPCSSFAIYLFFGRAPFIETVFDPLLICNSTVQSLTSTGSVPCGTLLTDIRRRLVVCRTARLHRKYTDNAHMLSISVFLTLQESCGWMKRGEKFSCQMITHNKQTHRWLMARRHSVVIDSNTFKHPILRSQEYYTHPKPSKTPWNV